MSCKKCNKDRCITDIGRGCCFCSNEGEDVEISICEGGHKLNVTDWLEEMPNNLPDNIFEIHFKNTRKGYFKNEANLSLKIGDVVAVEASPGHEIGMVTLTGDLVYKQMKKAGFRPTDDEFKKIYRKAKPYDIEKWQEAIALEHPTMIKARQIASDLKLNMKIGDVEYQGDRIKAIFYYIAEERVDFRELIRVFADTFKIRVEMRQIGARQEAGRIGGIGSCGRELCCASWISSFVSVTTNSARVQEISLNPQKLAGQCGKLKCCLIYELDTYIDARKEFPRINAPLEALDASYYLVKNDIFNRTMYFSSDPHSSLSLIPLSIERVREIIQINRRGKKVDKIIDESKLKLNTEVEPSYKSAVGEDSITRFDPSKRPNNNNNRNRTGGGGNNRPNPGTNPDGTSRPNRPQNRRPERVERAERFEKVDKPESVEKPKEASAPSENSEPRRNPQRRNNNKYRNRKPKNEA